MMALVVSVGVGVVVVVVPLFRFVSCSSRGSKCSSTSMVKCESRTTSSIRGSMKRVVVGAE